MVPDAVAISHLFMRGTFVEDDSRLPRKWALSDRSLRPACWHSTQIHCDLPCTEGERRKPGFVTMIGIGAVGLAGGLRFKGIFG
jgi:hypothetical protein